MTASRPATMAGRRRALDDFRQSYLLSYAPSGVSDTGWHEITVKVNRRSTIRARKGYQR
jgi:hypothetical protein